MAVLKINLVTEISYSSGSITQTRIEVEVEVEVEVSLILNMSIHLCFLRIWGKILIWKLHKKRLLGG
jgi:hypothetical protein